MDAKKPINPMKLYLGGMMGGLVIALIVILVVNSQKTPPPTTPPSAAPPSASAYAAWVALPEDAPVRAKLPAQAVVETEVLPIGENRTATQRRYIASDTNEQVYFVTTLEYPAPMNLEQPEPVLRAGLDGMVRAVPSNTLKETRFGSFQGMPALDFTIDDPAGALTHRGKLFARDRTFYQVFVTHNADKFDATAYEYFLSSFAAQP
ncbi:hypothetical protein HYV74_04060 [Candidatus Uhrbacteria bacterium]|nr:hypothetical protein [Candidatus Uhrbacteria bacterium]